jgi:hypothetical protein
MDIQTALDWLVVLRGKLETDCQPDRNTDRMVDALDFAIHRLSSELTSYRNYAVFEKGEFPW